MGAGQAGRGGRKELLKSKNKRKSTLDWSCEGEKVEEGRREGEQKERKEGDI